jgi:phage baseplate assembly protein W
MRLQRNSVRLPTTLGETPMKDPNGIKLSEYITHVTQQGIIQKEQARKALKEFEDVGFLRILWSSSERKKLYKIHKRFQQSKRNLSNLNNILESLRRFLEDKTVH